MHSDMYDTYCTLPNNKITVQDASNNLKISCEFEPINFD